MSGGVLKVESQGSVPAMPVMPCPARPVVSADRGLWQWPLSNEYGWVRGLSQSAFGDF